MADYKAKKVIFKNRDNEYLIPYIDNVYTKEEIDELLKDVPSGGGGSDSGGGLGLQLFDLIEKDHILTYEESKGLALLGTYVYKEAVAGSRYGYPDFYNKAVAEKEAGVATETTLGENTVTMYVNPNGHIFYDIADKEAVDAFYNIYGVAWYYGVDTENERVFLPRNNWFTQGGSSDDVGKFVEAGLPNITGACDIAYAEDIGDTGALSITRISAATLNTTGNAHKGELTLDASLSNPIYGNSDTVQPKAVKKLIYMCVGNTETTSTITDVVEVTTTENDTIPLFTGMYFDFTPNNVSWLKAGEQKNSGGIYETAYNELVKALTTSRGASTFSSNQVTKNITPTKVGTVNDDPIETQAYYFSENDYLSTTLEVGSEPFELQFKFRTLTDVTTPQGVIRDNLGGQDSFGLIIKNGNFYCNMWEERITQCTANTEYIAIIGRAQNYTYFKFSTDGGESFTNFQTGCFNPATVVLLDFGAPVNTSETGAVGFKGTIDLTNFVLTSTETQEETTDIIFDGKVIDVEAMVDGVDYSEYWKVDQNAMTFTTPIKTSERVLVDKKEPTEEDKTWHNLYSDGWFENGGTIATSGSVSAKDTKIFTISFSRTFVTEPDVKAIPVTETTSPYTCDLISLDNGGAIVGCKNTNTDNADKQLSGLKWEAKGYIEIPTSNNLYFKVANAVQNLELLDAGYILENMVDKQNMSAVSVCIEEYVNGTSWYRVYSDIGNGKWCEQGGQFTGYSEDNIISLLKSYKDTTYSVQATAVDKRHIVGVLAKTTTSIQFTVGQSSTSSADTLVDWVAKGYLA